MAADSPFIAQLLREHSHPGARVLEVGCGDKRFRSVVEGEYVGLDLPDSAYLREPPEVAASVEEIPLEDASFDLVFGVAVFLVVPDVERGFRECFRVLRPGGTLLVFDYQLETCRELARRDPDNHQHAWDANDLGGRLKTAGFERVADRSSLVDTADGPSWPLLVRRRIRRAMGVLGTWLIVEAHKPA